MVLNVYIYIYKLTYSFTPIPMLDLLHRMSTVELERDVHPGAGLARYYRVVELALDTPSEDVVEATLPQLQKLIGAETRGFNFTTFSCSYIFLCSCVLLYVFWCKFSENRRGFFVIMYSSSCPQPTSRCM